jgi:hypothetical protein
VRAHASVHPHLIGSAAEAAKVRCQGVAELLSRAGVNKRGNERNPERVGVPSWANRASSAEGKAAETAGRSGNGMKAAESAMEAEEAANKADS